MISKWHLSRDFEKVINDDEVLTDTLTMHSLFLFMLVTISL